MADHIGVGMAAPGLGLAPPPVPWIPLPLPHEAATLAGAAPTPDPRTWPPWRQLAFPAPAPVGAVEFRTRLPDVPGAVQYAGQIHAHLQAECQPGQSVDEDGKRVAWTVSRLAGTHVQGVNNDLRNLHHRLADTHRTVQFFIKDVALPIIVGITEQTACLEANVNYLGLIPPHMEQGRDEVKQRMDQILQRCNSSMRALDQRACQLENLWGTLWPQLAMLTLAVPDAGTASWGVRSAHSAPARAYLGQGPGWPGAQSSPGSHAPQPIEPCGRGSRHIRQVGSRASGPSPRPRRRPGPATAEPGAPMDAPLRWGCTGAHPPAAASEAGGSGGPMAAPQG